MKQILCLSNEPWSNRLPGRTQQLISRLRDAQILYFFPAQSPRDKSFLKQGRQVRPNVTACALPPIPFPISERHRRLFQMAWNKISRFIQETAARRRFTEPLLWTSHPRHIHLVDRLEYSALVYDCDRGVGRPPRPLGGQPGSGRRRGLCRLPPAVRPAVPMQLQHRPAAQWHQPAPL